MVEKILLSKMSWLEIEERLKQTDIAIIPVGSTEQHGYHLPISTDIEIAYNVAKKAAEKVIDDVKAVVAPPVPFGYSPEWLEWPGTISVRIETMRQLLLDIVGCLIHHGFKKIVIVNGHGSNPPILWQVMTETNRFKDRLLAVVNWYELITEEYNEIIEIKEGSHSEELETSMILAFGYDIDMSKATRYISDLPFPKYQDGHLDSLFHQKVYFWRVGELRDDMPAGVLGDGTRASKEKGEKILNAAVDKLAGLLRELNSKDLSTVKGL